MAFSISLIDTDTIMILSVVPGKNSWFRDNWIRAPDCDWKSLIVEPPFPITEPAAASDTRNLMYVAFSILSEFGDFGGGGDRFAGASGDESYEDSVDSILLPPPSSRRRRRRRRLERVAKQLRNGELGVAERSQKL